MQQGSFSTLIKRNGNIPCVRGGPKFSFLSFLKIFMNQLFQNRPFVQDDIHAYSSQNEIFQNQTVHFFETYA